MRFCSKKKVKKEENTSILKVDGLNKVQSVHSFILINTGRGKSGGAISYSSEFQVI